MPEPVTQTPTIEEPVPQGGPGDQATPPAEPQRKELRLAGKTYSVEPELYEAIEGYRREINERDGRRGSEMQALRDQLKRLEDAVTARPKQTDEAPKGPQLPAPDLQFTDPARYQRELIEYVEARVTAERAALEEKYSKDVEQRDAEAARRKVWDEHVAGFYRDNPDLVGEESLVEAIRRDHVDELKDLPLSAGFKKLADLTHERMIRYAGKVREKGGGAPPALESAGRPRDAAGRFTPGEERQPVGTLSSLIRAKQAKRAAA